MKVIDEIKEHLERNPNRLQLAVRFPHGRRYEAIEEIQKLADEYNLPVYIRLISDNQYCVQFFNCLDFSHIEQNVYYNI